MWRLGLSAALLASACQYDRPPDVMAIDAREVDAVDAPPPCTPSTIVCDDAASVYTECDAGGSVVRQLTCPLGCATDTEQCLDIDPHNGLAMYLDMVASPPDVVLVGPATLDPMTGLIFDGGRSIDVPTFVSADGIRVFVVNSLTVQGAVAVAPSANLSHPIAVVSRGDIVIRGVVDVSASRDLRAGARDRFHNMRKAPAASDDRACRPPSRAVEEAGELQLARARRRYEHGRRWGPRHSPRWTRSTADARVVRFSPLARRAARGGGGLQS
jgi:hypothetical protein